MVPGRAVDKAAAIASEMDWEVAVDASGPFLPPEASATDGVTAAADRVASCRSWKVLRLETSLTSEEQLGRRSLSWECGGQKR